MNKLNTRNLSKQKNKTKHNLKDSTKIEQVTVQNLKSTT